VTVETGVAAGRTAAVALAAMHESGDGHLYSIDLPPLEMTGDARGNAVPARYRSTLLLGSSRWVLPSLLQKLGSIDLFLHDSDHTRAAQLREYRTVWPYLSSGGVIVSDDVRNAAFVSFAEQVGARPYLVPRPVPDTAVGMLRKP